MTRKSSPVRPVETGTDYMTPLPLLGTATSKTGAVRIARAAGYRVFTVGGTVELSTDSVDPATGTEREVWTVTVHPPRT